ncbi:hypothetical protein DsansV1_C26g0190351 [Dioscorea sansibarensis]
MALHSAEHPEKELQWIALYNSILQIGKLTAFVLDLRQERQSLSVRPMSITFHSSTCRDYLCSLFSTENAYQWFLVD